MKDQVPLITDASHVVVLMASNSTQDPSSAVVDVAVVLAAEAPTRKLVDGAAAITSAVAVDFITRILLPKIGVGSVNVPAAVQLYVLPLKSALPFAGSVAIVAICSSRFRKVILVEALNSLLVEESLLKL